MKPVELKVARIWEETVREMVARREDWTAWETTVADGLREIPWDTKPRRDRGSSRPKR